MLASFGCSDSESLNFFVSDNWLNLSEILNNYWEIAKEMPGFDLFEFVKSTAPHERVKLFGTLKELTPFLVAYQA